MKRILTTLFSLSVLYATQAQVILTRDDVPPVGTMMINYNADIPSNFSFNKSGSNNKWNFTTITPLPTLFDTVRYLDPKTTPGNSFFPGASLVTKGSDGIYNYAKLEAIGVSILGLYGDIAGFGTSLPIPLTPPVIVFPFPYTQTVNYSGSVLIERKLKASDLGVPIADSVWLKRRQVASIKVVANGEIVLPSGTYPALLEENITTSIDSSKMKFLGTWTFIPNSPSRSTDTTYNWYIDGSTEPVAFAVYENGAISDLEFRKTDQPLSLSPFYFPTNSVNCFPNPASESFQLLGFAPENIKNILIISSLGETVRSIYSPESAVWVKDLEQGLYQIKITLTNSKVLTTKLIKL